MKSFWEIDGRSELSLLLLFITLLVLLLFLLFLLNAVGQLVDLVIGCLERLAAAGDRRRHSLERAG